MTSIKGKHFLGLIRHGMVLEKPPSSNTKAANFIDLPLSESGKKQAEEAGLFLQDFLMQRGYHPILLESSPFLGTMATASIIAKKLALKNFKINYRIADWLE